MSGVHFCDDCGAANPTNAPFCWNCKTSFQQAGLLGGRYKIVKQLGVGGMGTVHLALDTTLQNKRVAIKEVDDPADILQELTLLAYLDHPRIPPITDTFTENNKHFLVMKYIEGENLEDVIVRQSLSFDEILVLGEELCDILGYLHTQNPQIIFRDLKPGNILLDTHNSPYLIDFGISRTWKANQTKDTTALGSPGYAPPEQYNKSQTDQRSDIYSLGATLYSLFTKDNPADHPFVFNRQLLETVRPGIWGRFMSLLEMDMKKRPASMTDVKIILRTLSSAPLPPQQPVLLYQAKPTGTNIFFAYAPKDKGIMQDLTVYLRPLQTKYPGLTIFCNQDDVAPGTHLPRYWDMVLRTSFVIIELYSMNFLMRSGTVNNSNETLYDYFHDTILSTAQYLKKPVLSVIARKLYDDPKDLFQNPYLPASGIPLERLSDPGYREVVQYIESLAQIAYGY